MEVSPTRRLWMAITYVLLAATALLMLVPFVYLVCSAFKTNDDVFRSTFLPAGYGLLGADWGRLTLDNFRRLFTEMDFGRHMLNSVFLASVTSILATLASAMGGFVAGGSGGVGSVRRLDLDHFGAKISQQLTAKRTSNELAELNYAKAG